jgi:hypothetical protein
MILRETCKSNLFLSPCIRLADKSFRVVKNLSLVSSEFIRNKDSADLTYLSWARTDTRRADIRGIHLLRNASECGLRPHCGWPWGYGDCACSVGSMLTGESKIDSVELWGVKDQFQVESDNSFIFNQFIKKLVRSLSICQIR